MKTQLVKVNKEYKQFLDTTNLEVSGDISITVAKSVLSTELVRILTPIVYGTGMSPMSLVKDIIDNINLEYFKNNNNQEVLKSLLFNEFYKVLLELQSLSNNLNFDFNSKLDSMCNDISSTVYYTISILSNNKK